MTQQPQDPDPADPIPAATTDIPVVAPVPSNAPANPPAGQTVPGSAPTVIPAALPPSVVVGGQTATLGGAPITVDSSIVQLTPSGIIVHDQAGGPVNTIAIPTPVAGQPQASPVVATIGNQVMTVAPVPAAPAPTNPAQANPVAGQPAPIATIDGEVVIASPGASTVVIKGQTATIGGAPVTLAGSNVVATLGASALIVQYPGGGVSTYALPAAGTKPTSVGSPIGAPTAIATVGGEVISASPGASTVVIKGQTATIGGAPITLAGSNIVATLGPSALIIQYPNGVASTYALPSAAAKTTLPPGVPITVGGQVISIAPGASTLVLGTQTLKIGGPAMTIAGNQVVSLSPAGLIVQLPGGGVKTLVLTSGSYSATATAGSSSTNAVGGIIASSKLYARKFLNAMSNIETVMGVPSPAPPAGANPSVPTSTASIVSTKASNGTVASTQSGANGGASTTGNVLTVAPGSAGTRINVRCMSIIPWLGAVIIFGVIW